jgi:hypothetical protein
MKKTLFLFLFSLIIFSCEKAGQLTVENTDIPLISKVLIGDETYMEYSYNSANLVTEEKSKFHYTKHIYNDNNQLTESDFYWDISIASSDSRVIEAAMKRQEWVNPDNTPKSVTHSLEYNTNGQLIRKSYIRPSDSNSDYNEFTYENDRISRQTMYSRNIVSNYIDYIYDEKGNLIKESKYRVSSTVGSELLTTTEYEYDNMHNPYQSFKRLLTPGIYTNQNNITKETYTIHFEVDAFTQKVQVTNYIYEYNNKGYPVRVNGETGYVYK